MPDSTVQQIGGDFSTLATALADAGTGVGDTITPQGPWTVDDTAAATVADDSIRVRILSTNASYHDGVYDTTQDHYRLRDSGSQSILVNNTGCIIDGLAISQGGGASDEGIRMAADGGTVTIQNCIIWGDTNVSEKDGIFIGSISCTINIENTIIYDWGRAGLHSQITTGTSETQTWNINSVTLWNNGITNALEAGGIVVRITEVTATLNMNIFNTISVENTDFGEDYSEEGAAGTAIWNIDNCISSDASISNLDAGAVGAQENRTATDNTSPGVGDFVIFTDITGAAPLNLLLVDNSTDNDAQDAHSNTSGAGLILPVLDIEAQIRERGANEIDVGADSIPNPPPEPGLPEYGQPRAAIGDPSVYGATIVRS